MLHMHIGLWNCLQTFSLKHLKQKVIYKGNYFLLSQIYVQMRMSTHLLRGKAWKGTKKLYIQVCLLGKQFQQCCAPHSQCRMLHSRIPQWAKNRLVFLMKTVDFSLGLYSKQRCWKPEYSRVVLTHAGSQIFLDTSRQQEEILCLSDPVCGRQEWRWKITTPGHPKKVENL